jgi:hypothetical protein
MPGGEDLPAIECDPQQSCRRGWRHLAVEPRAHLVSVRVFELLQDVRGLLPGMPGLCRLTGRVVGVAEVDQPNGLVVAGAEPSIVSRAVWEALIASS